MIDLVAGRGELTDVAWKHIEPLLPRVDGRGRPWRDHRQVVNGVLWRLRTGAPWRDLPERYGPWQTVYERFARWEADGTWAKLLEQVQVRDDAVGRVEWTVAVDSTVNRAHQHASGARKKGSRVGDELDDPGRSQARQALDRSRGGLTRRRRPGPSPVDRAHPGNRNDATAFAQVLAGIRVPRPTTGRPLTTPQRLLGDKAYSSRAIRHLLRRRGIAATIPERRDQAANRRRRGRLSGRPPAFDQEAYRDRNVVERCFARLRQFRAIATRFDKLADRYRAGVVLASLILWLREPTR
ncbi:IS5 family transposase [Streptomyces sp. NPDC046161]|uniref:IS5 family transposase n=1 Tax=Streptomyces sp. NPDC046161 TaxID=3155132 RepID=UPI0033C116D8